MPNLHKSNIFLLVLHASSLVGSVFMNSLTLVNAYNYYDDFISVAPNPPVINAIIDINNSTVRVTWTRPTMLNGIITVYTIIYFTDSYSGNMSVPYNGGEVNNFILSGVNNYLLLVICGKNLDRDKEDGETCQTLRPSYDQFKQEFSLFGKTILLEFIKQYIGYLVLI